MAIIDLPRRLHVVFPDKDPINMPVLNYSDSGDTNLDGLVEQMDNLDAIGVYELVRFVTKGPSTDSSPVEEDDGA